MTIQDPNVFLFRRPDAVTTDLRADLSTILSSFNFATSIQKYNFQVNDPGTLWSGLLQLTALNFGTPVLAINSTTTNGTVNATNSTLTGGNVIAFNTTFNYNGKVTATGTISGTGTILFSVVTLNLTRTDVLPSNATGVIAVDFSSTAVNFDAAYPTDAYSVGLRNQLVANLTTTLATTVTTDLQTAVSAYYTHKTVPTNWTLTTQFPEVNYTYNLTWTDAPVYNASGVIYSMQGNATPQAAPQPQKVLAKKSKGFLKMFVEEEIVSAVPTFNPDDGSKQISITTDSLVFDIMDAISASGKLSFPITDANTGSSQFSVNTDSLSRIYPGIMTAYARDAPINVSAFISNVTYAEDPLAGTLNMTVSVRDAQGFVVLEWISIVKFYTTYIYKPTFNVQLSSLSQDLITITSAPFGFVDASTLGRWIDDSFANYMGSWNLFKTGIDLTPYVGAYNVTTANGKTIFYSGN